MRFQGLAVVLGKKRWPAFIARQRKKDFGLDAYAPADLTADGISRGLAASITPRLEKIASDAETAKKNFPDLQSLLFVTPAKVGNLERKTWEEAVRKDHGVELHVIEREEIIALMMMPENASVRASFLYLDGDSEPEVADLIARTRRAATSVTKAWAGKIQGHPLVELTAVRLEPSGRESAEVLSLGRIDQLLWQGSRIVLEGPAGRGKTTTLIQLALCKRTVGTAFMVDLPAWTSSGRSILDYIAGIPAFLAEGLTAADLARSQQTEPFLFLLNGWNEIGESNSNQANNVLRELERDFPGAGIIVATRTHHITPPLAGALRLRLSRLLRAQRTTYLKARLGSKGAELCAHIDADRSLDELTRTPFTLSVVASLFAAGAKIPSTRIGVLAEVLHLHEQRDEHRNSLEVAPLFGRTTAYLSALAREMTCRGAVTLLEADARAVITAVAQRLVNSGEVEPVGAPTTQATLIAHHVLELVDYPQVAIRFEHHQFQEYYVALDICGILLNLRDDAHDINRRFTADYLNDPRWAEPLRMIAETLSEQSGVGGTDKERTCAGGMLVKMALAVDLVFAGELAQLCGSNVWDQVRAVVNERFRAVYSTDGGNYRQYSLAAMLASGMEDFSDIIVPLFSSRDQQTRLRTLRLWSDLRVSSLGLNWREEMHSWSEEARADFVSEALYHRIDGEIVAFAIEDNSVAVKTAAASSLMWTGSDNLLIRVLESMDVQTFEEVACKYADQMPPALRSKIVAAMQSFIEASTDHPARLLTALRLVKFGEKGLDDVIKDALMTMPSASVRNLPSHCLKAALAHLRESDLVWPGEWVGVRISEGTLYSHERWLSLATAAPSSLIEEHLRRIETEDLQNVPLEGTFALIAAHADIGIAVRVFAQLRRLRQKVDAEPGQQHQFERQVMRQLETVFRHFPGDVAAAGLLSCIKEGDPLDVAVAAGLLSRVARSGEEPIRMADDDLRVQLREYLKNSVGLVLGQDDFDGEEKANLASAIAQIGEPKDMEDLVVLIRADIERRRDGRSALAAGDRGPIATGGRMSYARWHIAAAIHLDPSRADQVLIDLIGEPEYRIDVADAMTHDFIARPEHSLHTTLHYDSMWAARKRRTTPPGNLRRRERFAAALRVEIKRLQEQNKDENGESIADLQKLAAALAAIDGRGSTEVVLDAIAVPSEWNQHTCLVAAERLLMAGVVLPATTAVALIDSILERTQQWMQDSDRSRLCQTLALCPFVDDPAAGVAKVREVLRALQLRGHILRDIVTALGESRSDAAVDLLCELAADARTFEQCDKELINAFAALDTPRTRELLLSLVDPDTTGITLTHKLRHEPELVARLAELTHRSPEAATRLHRLCERDLPELNRQILSKVLGRMGTPEALAASLNLIDDTRPSPVPIGLWRQLESAFVERRPYGLDSNSFVEHPRASNDLRLRLFWMALQDSRRKKSASILLGQIEEWRLEHGRPALEPRHPDLASGRSWPPAQR